jgi:hypothetical protein
MDEETVVAEAVEAVEVAPEAPTAAEELKAEEPKFPRKPRGAMEEQLRETIAALVAAGDERQLTTALLADETFKRHQGTGVKPSTGAIADNLKRWAKIGYCTINEKPLAFLCFTEAAATEGLAALKEKGRAAGKATRAAAKAAAKAAAEAEAPAVEIEPETIEVVAADQPDVEVEVVEHPVGTFVVD